MRLLITLLALTIACFSADNSLGTWKRNIEKSKTKLPQSNPIKTLTMVREAAGNGVKVTNTGTRADGSPANWSHTAQYDGTSAAVTGNSLFDTVSIKQVDASTF